MMMYTCMPEVVVIGEVRESALLPIQSHVCSLRKASFPFALAPHIEIAGAASRVERRERVEAQLGWDNKKGACDLRDFVLCLALHSLFTPLLRSR
jgi:hypothetical protein